MDMQDKEFEIHSLYNLSRYLFLKLESNYFSIVEKSGITLPQLRVLWIIKSFPGISLGRIAQIGCWSPPTVTNILKILIEKNLVYNDDSSSKRLYRLNTTDKGEKYINANRQNKGSNFAIFKLANLLNKEELDCIIDYFKILTVKSDNTFIFDYVERVNDLSLKINYDDFELNYGAILKTLVLFENMLRTFVLASENNHSNLLASLNITYPQTRALWILKAFPGITSSELSQLGYWSPSTANLVVKNLYGKGYIYKIKGDVKNSLHLFVSDEGHALLMEDYKIRQKHLDIHKIVESISTDELVKLNKILYKMNIKLGNNMLSDYIKKTYKIEQEEAII